MSMLYDNWLSVYRRGAVIAITVGSAVATALLASLLMPNVYESATEFYLSSDPQAFGVIWSSGKATTPVLLAKDNEKWMVGIAESAAVRERVHRSVPHKSVAELLEDVDVDVTRKHIIRVKVLDRDPQVAAMIANAYPGAIRGFLRAASAVRGKETSAAYQEALSEVDREVVETQQKMERLLADQHSPGVQADMQKLLGRRTVLETVLEKARASLEGIDQRINVATAQLNAEATLRGAVFSPDQLRLMKDVSDLEAELAAARVEFDGKYSERHPRIKSLTVRLQRKQAELEQENVALKTAEVKPFDFYHEQLRREILGLYKDRSAAKAEIISDTQSLSALEQRIGKLPPGMLREQETQAEIDRLEKSRDVLRQKQLEIRTNSAVETSPVVVVATATPSPEAKFPRPLFNALMAALLGLIAGIYMALAYDFDARARSVAPR
jgi:capsular polysaccharide biosynthesis protein